MQPATKYCAAPLKYGKKYSYVLERMDIKDLLILPPAKQRHIMKALANLANYNGVYEQWNNLRRRHQLKWSSTNTLDVFERIINNDTTYNKMLEYVKQILVVLPRAHANVIVFGTLTGLRPMEACKSVQLIHTDLSNYRNFELHLRVFQMEEYLHKKQKKYQLLVYDRSTLANSQDHRSSIIYIHLRLLT